MSTLKSKRFSRHGLAERLYRHGLATLGVQSFMLDASVRLLHQLSRRLGIDPQEDAAPPAPSSRPHAPSVPAAPDASHASHFAHASPAGHGLDPAPSDELSASSNRAESNRAESHGADSDGAALLGAVSHAGSSAADSIAPSQRVLNTEASLRDAILELREAIASLDDVHAFDTIRAIDNDMYHLWKELERKMQRHRQSEAKAQLKGMFNL